MDLHIRFWDSNKDVVATRHYSSEFLGKSSPNDICSHFKTVYCSIRERKTSSSFSRCTKREFTFSQSPYRNAKDEELNQLIDLGTCGLHTANNAFKHGEKASDWQLKKLM